MSESAIRVIQQRAGGGLRRVAESAGLTITHGQGSFLFDDQGRGYLDFIAGFGVTAVGHAHPTWVRRVTRQTSLLSSCPFYTDSLADYLMALHRRLPASLDRTALFSSGTEATETAIRLTQRATGRAGVLSFLGSFHGMSAGVRYAGGRHSEERARIGTGWLFDASYPQCRDHNPIEYPTCEGSGEDVIRGLDSRDDLSSIGSVILEPLLGTAGNIPPERRFLEKLRRVCDQRDWLLILDESVTGFGRLGQFLASDWFSVTPDVLVLGKGMGGGFPLSGVVASSELWSRSELDMPSVTSTSYGGNPVACAAGVAVLEVLDEGLDVSKTGQSLAQGLVALESASPFVVCSRGIGLMQGFDLIDPETGEAASPELCTTLFRRLLRKGLLLVADVPQVRLTPPLTISIAEVEMCLDILNSVLAP